MIKNLVTLNLLILMNHLALAQIKGIVKDEKTQKPVEYANIWVKDVNKGTSSDALGNFELSDIKEGEFLVISAVGYEQKTIAFTELKEVIYLKPSVLQLAEIVVKPSKKQVTREIGNFNASAISAYYGTSHSTPWILARKFTFDESYKKTPYIEKVKVLTLGNVNNAKINIHLYTVDENGKPAQHLIKENIVALTKKRKKLTTIDVSQYNLVFPENGIFVAVEQLIIEENKYQYLIHSTDTKKNTKAIGHSPSIGSLPGEDEFESFRYIEGKWFSSFKSQAARLKEYDNKYWVPAISIVLSD